MKTFSTELSTKHGDKINIEYSKLAKKQSAPVLRKNPPIIRSFEVLTNLVGLPKYGSIDPTPLMAIFFTFYWGFMVGDIGYGLIIFAMMTALPRLMPTKFEGQAIKDLMTIFKVAATSSIIFGILYGEFLGDIGEHYFHLHPIWMNRYETDQMLSLLVISIIIGYLVVLFGLILGIINNLKLGHKSHARSDAALFALWGSILVGLVIGIIIPDIFSTILVITLIFVFIMMGVLIWLEKVAGIIHVIERFSNILSFARLMAIGLVGAQMAAVANEISAEGVFNKVLGEGIGFVVGIIFTLSLHLINIMILILSPTIHSLRLNVYEFFSQFSQTGDVIKYAPYQSI
jgi:V/A-type H+-transporting ATPase subunit I